MKNGNEQLSELVPMGSPDAVLEEVQVILNLISPNFNTAPAVTAFNTTVRLYQGQYPGYQACNTKYHDLRHTTDTFLAMARLLHGAVLDGETFTDRHIVLTLITALLHDAGYIQEENDLEGTGAKHTTDHVQRSIDFLKFVGPELGLTDEEITAGGNMILCTDLAVDISTISFPNAKIELLAKMLAVADLLAQMADRTYLEKLLFLYREFREAKVGDYESEIDLLRKTMGFYNLISHRLETMLDGTDRFMTSHFISRWKINSNLYQDAIEKQRKYLHQILESPNSDPCANLKRGGIVDSFRKKYGKKKK